MERNEFKTQTQTNETGGPGLSIRRATPRDRVAIERLAERDSSPAPEGEVLIAAIGERPLAAISLDDGTAVADPFEHSAEALSMLRARDRRLRRGGFRGRLGGHGRGSLAGSPPGAGGRLLILPPR